MSKHLRLRTYTNITFFLNKRRNAHKYNRIGDTNTCEKPEETRTMELCKETTTSDVVLDNRNQYIANCYSQ